MQLAVRTRGSTNSRRTSGYGRNSSPGQRVQTAIGSADSIQDGRLRHRRFGHTRPDAGTHTSMRCRRGGRADVAQRRGHVGAADCLGRGEAARQRFDQCDAAPSRGSDDHHSGSGRRARPTCAGETTISRTANVVCESLGRRHLRPEVRCRLIGAQRGDAHDRRVRPGWREPVSGFSREHLLRSHRRHDVTPAAPSHATVTRLQGHRDRRRGRGDLVQHPQVGHRVAALTRGDRADERRDR